MERVTTLDQTVSPPADFHWLCKSLISLNVCPSAELSTYVVVCAQTRILEQKQRPWPMRAAVIQVGALRHKNWQENLSSPAKAARPPQACTNACAHPQRKGVNRISKHYITKAFKETFIIVSWESQRMCAGLHSLVVLSLPKSMADKVTFPRWNLGTQKWLGGKIPRGNKASEGTEVRKHHKLRREKQTSSVPAPKLHNRNSFIS